MDGSPRAFALKVAKAAKASALSSLLTMPMFMDLNNMINATDKWSRNGNGDIMNGVTWGQSDHPIVPFLVKYANPIFKDLLGMAPVARVITNGMVGRVIRMLTTTGVAGSCFTKANQNSSDLYRGVYNLTTDSSAACVTLTVARLAAEGLEAVDPAATKDVQAVLQSDMPNEVRLAFAVCPSTSTKAECDDMAASNDPVIRAARVKALHDSVIKHLALMPTEVKCMLKDGTSTLVDTFLNAVVATAGIANPAAGASTLKIIADGASEVFKDLNGARTVLDDALHPIMCKLWTTAATSSTVKVKIGFSYIKPADRKSLSHTFLLPVRQAVATALQVAVSRVGFSLAAQSLGVALKGTSFAGEFELAVSVDSPLEATPVNKKLALASTFAAIKASLSKVLGYDVTQKAPASSGGSGGSSGGGGATGGGSSKPPTPVNGIGSGTVSTPGYKVKFVLKLKRLLRKLSTSLIAAAIRKVYGKFLAKLGISAKEITVTFKIVSTRRRLGGDGGSSRGRRELAATDEVNYDVDIVVNTKDLVAADDVVKLFQDTTAKTSLASDITREIVQSATDQGQSDAVTSIGKTDLVSEPDIMSPPGATCGPVSADKIPVAKVIAGNSMAQTVAGTQMNKCKVLQIKLPASKNGAWGHKYTLTITTSDSNGFPGFISLRTDGKDGAAGFTCPCQAPQALNGFEATTKVSASTATLALANGLKGGSNVDLYVRSTDTTPLSINMISVEVGAAVEDPSKVTPGGSGGSGPSMQPGDTGGDNNGATLVGGLPLALVAGIAGGGVALIAIIAIIAIVVVRKRNRHGANGLSPRIRKEKSHRMSSNDEAGTELPGLAAKGDVRINKQESTPQLRPNPMAKVQKQDSRLSVHSSGSQREISADFSVEKNNPLSEGPALAPIMPNAMPVSGSSEWVECVDPATGSTYFANKATGATQWERPKQ